MAEQVTREELAEALRMSTELMAHAGGYAGTVAMNRSILSRLDAENGAETHSERIRCPECGQEQDATVQHTRPFWTYVHDCVKCGYTIMESEWEVVE